MSDVNAIETKKPDLRKLAPPPPAPKLLDSPGSKTTYRLAPKCPVNVGDLMAQLGDGTVCAASCWPRTGDVQGDRRAFAAAFKGCSGTYADHKYPRHGATTEVSHAEVQAGGNWLFAVVAAGSGGPPAADSLVGPALVGEFMLSPGTLETVADEREAVGKIVKAEAGGWRVKIKG